MNKLNASSRQEVYNVSVIVAQSVWLHSLVHHGHQSPR